MSDNNFLHSFRSWMKDLSAQCTPELFRQLRKGYTKENFVKDLILCF